MEDFGHIAHPYPALYMIYKQYVVFIGITTTLIKQTQQYSDMTDPHEATFINFYKIVTVLHSLLQNNIRFHKL